MLKYLPVLFISGLLSNIALGVEVTERELDQFVHRYLNDNGGYNDRHCHDGYCYFNTLRGDINVYWSNNYGDEEYEKNMEYVLAETWNNSNARIKIEINEAQAIVKASLRQHLDLFDYLSDITTSFELLPYLEKYKALKVRFTGRIVQPYLRIILVGDQHIPPDFIREVGVARCDFTEGIVLVNVNSWNSCIKHDDVFSEFLIFHEVVHCDLKRFHDDGEENNLSFMNQFLTAHIFHQIVTGPIRSCRYIDPLGLFEKLFDKEMSDGLSFSRNYIEDNFEELYAETFSKDKFYDYDESHYEYEPYDGRHDHTLYMEVEDLSEFTTVVNNDLIAIKQKLQQLARDQQQNL